MLNIGTIVKVRSEFKGTTTGIVQGFENGLHTILWYKPRNNNVQGPYDVMVNMFDSCADKPNAVYCWEPIPDSE